MNRRWWQRFSAPLALSLPLGALPLSAQCPPEADSLAYWAHEALRFSSWPEADSLTREMTLQFPECPEGFLVRSYYLSATQRTLQARDLLERALDLDPGHVQALKMRGMLGWMLEDWDGALRDMEGVLASSTDPDEHYQARALRAAIHLERSDLDSALEEAEAMIALNPDYPDAYGVRAQIWEKRGEWGQRAEDLQRVLDREKETSARVATLVALGGARIELGQLAEARRVLEDAARLDAAVGRIYYFRARVNQMEGRLAEARADLRLAIVGANSAQHRQEAQQLLAKLGAGL